MFVFPCELQTKRYQKLCLKLVLVSDTKLFAFKNGTSLSVIYFELQAIVQVPEAMHSFLR